MAAERTRSFPVLRRSGSAGSPAAESGGAAGAEDKVAAEGTGGTDGRDGTAGAVAAADTAGVAGTTGAGAAATEPGCTGPGAGAGRRLAYRGRSEIASCEPVTPMWAPPKPRPPAGRAGGAITGPLPGGSSHGLCSGRASCRRRDHREGWAVRPEGYRARNRRPGPLPESSCSRVCVVACTVPWRPADFEAGRVLCVGIWILAPQNGQIPRLPA